MYYGWKCNKDTSENTKILDIISVKNNNDKMYITSAIIVVIMWICSIILFTSSLKKTNIPNGSNTYSNQSESTSL
jgi:hypothetical protein